MLSVQSHACPAVAPLLLHAAFQGALPEGNLGSQVLLASPCSGHGYKFCSVIGEIMADLALEGSTRHGIDICRIERSRTGFAELLDGFQRSADTAKSKL